MRTDYPLKSFLPAAIGGSLVSVGLACITQLGGYRVAPLFLVPLIWLPVVLRRKLVLHPGHHLAYVVAVLIHNLGALGWYQGWPGGKWIEGFSFDILVHFYFGFAAIFIVRRFLKAHLDLGPWASSGLALLCVMGCGALHEIMEYGTYLVLGEKNGMLKPATSYFFDTQRDLLDNLLGVLLGLAVMGMIGVTRGRRVSYDGGDESLSAPSAITR
jgi:uncharacterized membrane protein YjdF